MTKERPAPQPQPMTPEPSPVLTLIGGGRGSAQLRVPLSCAGVARDDWLTIRLECRHVRVLRILNDALGADRDIDDESLRGWMSDEQIVAAFERQEPHAIPPNPQTIAAYRSQINNALRAVTPPGRRTPTVFLSERKTGVRLARALEVRDLSTRREATSACSGLMSP